MASPPFQGRIRVRLRPALENGDEDHCRRRNVDVIVLIRFSSGVHICGGSSSRCSRQCCFPSLMPKHEAPAGVRAWLATSDGTGLTFSRISVPIPTRPSATTGRLSPTLIHTRAKRAHESLESRRRYSPQSSIESRSHFMRLVGAILAIVLILSACATGHYQWVDTQGQGQAVFNAAHSRCLSVGQNARAMDDARVASERRDCVVAALNSGRGADSCAVLAEIGRRSGAEQNAYFNCMAGFGFQRRFVSN